MSNERQKESIPDELPDNSTTLTPQPGCHEYLTPRPDWILEEPIPETTIIEAVNPPEPFVPSRRTKSLLSEKHLFTTSLGQDDMCRHTFRWPCININACYLLLLVVP